MKFFGRKVLFLGAHPDDIELGCGALLAHIASQAEVLCVTLSDNQKNPALKDLVGEHRRSMAELGVGPERIVLGEFETRYFPRDRQQILEYLYDLNRQHRPEIVFVHTQSDIHQDHGVTTVEAMRAFRGTTVLGFDVLRSSYGFFPQFLVEVTAADAEKKVRALSASTPRTAPSTTSIRMSSEPRSSARARWPRCPSLRALRAFGSPGRFEGSRRRRKTELNATPTRSGLPIGLAARK